MTKEEAIAVGREILSLLNKTRDADFDVPKEEFFLYQQAPEGSLSCGEVHFEASPKEDAKCACGSSDIECWEWYLLSQDLKNASRMSRASALDSLRGPLVRILSKHIKE